MNHELKVDDIFNLDFIDEAQNEDANYWLSHHIIIGFFS